MILGIKEQHQAIEDAIVLAEELQKHADHETQHYRLITKEEPHEHSKSRIYPQKSSAVGLKESRERKN